MAALAREPPFEKRCYRVNAVEKVVITIVSIISVCLRSSDAMYCLANICYVCLEKKSKSISNINSSFSVNKDIINIIGYRPFKLGWLKTKRIILICEACCLRLRETYQFLALCLKNSALLQGYMDNLTTSTVSSTENEEELTATLDINIIHEEIDGVNCEIKLEDEEMYRDECGPILEQTEDVCVNVEDYFVKDEDTWKREVADDKEEHVMDNNSAAETDNVWETSVNSNAYITNTDSVSSGFTCKQVCASNKKELNTAAKKSYTCSTCNISYNKKIDLKRHTRAHAGEKPLTCTRCEKGFSHRSYLVQHMRIHTGEKPFECSKCGKRFKLKSYLVRHKRLHTGEKPFKCSRCEKCFVHKSYLVIHMRTHTGEKRYECSECRKCFNLKSDLSRHMRVHTGEKPFKCSSCEKCYGDKSYLVTHMRTHTSEKPFKCSSCEKCFNQRSSLVCHMRTHTGEKPYECSVCSRCFTNKCNLVTHMRSHTGTIDNHC